MTRVYCSHARALYHGGFAGRGDASHIAGSDARRLSYSIKVRKGVAAVLLPMMLASDFIFRGK
jgi:hypothetical protein